MNETTVRHGEKAKIFSRRPPVYAGNDPYLKEVGEYLQYLTQTLEHKVSQLQKKMNGMEE